MNPRRRRLCAATSRLQLLLQLPILLLLGCGGGGEAQPAKADSIVVDPTVPPVADPPVDGRLVVLVVAGVDADLVERWRSDMPAFDHLSAGRNLPRLASLAPVNAQRAAAQLATGRLALGPRLLGGSWLDPVSLSMLPAPAPTLPLGTEPFWVTAARAGVSTRALWAPYGLPPQPVPGLWVLPDGLAAFPGASSVTLLTPDSVPPSGPKDSDLVQLQGDPPWQAQISLGPGKPWSVEISEPHPDAYRLTVGSTRADLRLGEVSAPIVIRRRVDDRRQSVALRLSAIPAGDGAAITLLPPGLVGGPHSPVTSPASFADDWARFHGPVDTTGGCAGLLDGFRTGLVSAGALARDLADQAAARQSALLGELGRRDARLVVAWLPSAGLAGQAFAGLADSGHPAWTSELAARHGGDPKTALARLDETLGHVQAALLPGDRLLLVSGSGVISQRVQVDLNAALVDAGLLALDPSVSRDRSPSLATAVDWTGSSAYATGPGFVFLNRVDRQAEGTVDDRHVDAVLTDLNQKLGALSWHDKPVVASITPGTERFPTAAAGDRPDLVVDLVAGVGWSPELLAGRVGPAAVAPNSTGLTGAWGGTNAADAAGFAVTNFGPVDAGARLVDIAPTVLRALGLTLPAGQDGAPWSLVGPSLQTPEPP
ncbi:MAG: hypothetical protein GXP62_02380 [Oligoflexia bacterium]|nr:hypothetical protein [Oligoflexia bacterium]